MSVFPITKIYTGSSGFCWSNLISLSSFIINLCLILGFPFPGIFCARRTIHYCKEAVPGWESAVSTIWPQETFQCGPQPLPFCSLQFRFPSCFFQNRVIQTSQPRMLYFLWAITPYLVWCYNLQTRSIHFVGVVELCWYFVPRPVATLLLLATKFVWGCSLFN